MQLSIIIVNYNVKYFLEQCLCSLALACKNLKAEIIVVDNKSTDGSKGFFTGRFNHVRFIWNGDNIGFSKANNLALKEVTGTYILFLNPDTIVPEDCLEKCISFLDKNKTVGGLGVKMIDGGGNFLKESKRGLPDPFTSLYKLVGLTKIFPHSGTFAKYYLGHLSENNDQEIDILAGAFMMVTRAVLNITGGFDERFFMYGEDVDLSYRIRKAGFRNYYLSSTTIVHFKGESTQRNTVGHVRLFYGAMLLFVKKHYNGGRAIAYQSAIRSAIRLKSLQVTVANLLKRSTHRKKNPSYGPCFIVAGKAGYEKIAAILNQLGWQGKIVGRVAAKDEEKPGAIGSITNLGELIRAHNVGEIIFSNDAISLKEIIFIMQQSAAGLSYKFYLKGSSAIIGSSNKDAAGYYIALENS